MDVVLTATVVGSVAAVAAVVVGLWQGWLAVAEHRRQKRTEREAAVAGISMLELQRRGQATERFTRAVEQLGSEKLDVRIGAVYALEQIARDSPELHGPTMEMLTAYLREHAHVQPIAGGPVVREAVPHIARLPADVQAIATVIGRRERAQDPVGQRLDLRETDLSGVNWVRADLEGADLSNARLEGADLREARLERTVFAHARLQDAFLTDAQLKGADLSGAQVEVAILRHVNLERAQLVWAQLAGSNLEDANLQGADLTAAGLDHAILRGAQLKGARLRRARLEGALLEDANLEDADLLGAQLSGAILRQARMQGALLEDANLQGADLTGAQLQLSLLNGARLDGANLSGARLKAAYLRGANMEGANLGGAHLDSAYLGDVRGLTWEQLETAIDWDRAHLPADLAERLTRVPGFSSSTSSEPGTDATAGDDPG
jgi:uncharacterized protein YjbI with pentapeptide repeats